jgi:alpha-glucuronidase
MMLRNSWYEQTAGKLCKCSKSKKILKNIWLQLKLVKLRRHINKGKIVTHIRLQKKMLNEIGSRQRERSV